jgi:monothiol glutaredoxin
VIIGKITILFCLGETQLHHSLTTRTVGSAQHGGLGSGIIGGYEGLCPAIDYFFDYGTTDMSDAQQRIDELVKGNEVLLFMKGTASFPQCGFSGRAIQILKACGVDPKSVKTVNVLEDDGIRQGIKEYSSWPTIPQLYVKGEFIGGSDIMMEMYESGELVQALGKA